MPNHSTRSKRRGCALARLAGPGRALCQNHDTPVQLPPKMQVPRQGIFLPAHAPATRRARLAMAARMSAPGSRLSAKAGR